MPTFIEVVTDWAQQLRAQHNNEIAILSRNATLYAYAVAAPAADTGADHRTAACIVMQSQFWNAQANLLALSYAPTAACIGMATLLGIRRIVWLNAATGVQHSMTLHATNAPAHQVGGAQAVVIQAVATAYANIPALPVPLPPLAFPPVIRPHQFGLPSYVVDLVSGLNGPDDTVRDNMCTQLAFAIAFRAHGPLRPGMGVLPLRRRPGYYGQNIASVMVDQTYNILGWAVNTNVAHPSYHGEINMIRQHQRTAGQALPNNGKLFTTLEPCVMCSGMIVHATGPANTFSVVSGQSDFHVGYSALRTVSGVDGATANARVNTHHSIARTPHLPGSSFSSGMSAAQGVGLRWMSPGAGQMPRMMQPPVGPTTRFLESQTGKDFMDDASRMLNMQAALWLPTASRGAWRRKLSDFLDFVEDVV